MADNDYNIIKPVDSLQNITGLKPTKRREERKRKQNSREQTEQTQQQNETVTGQNTNEQLEENGNQPTIDYCA